MQNYKILNIPKMNLYFDRKKNKTNDTAPIISFIGGTMLLDGEPVQAYYGKGVYYWEREKEKGCLWLRHFGLMGEGFIDRDGVRHNFKAGAETAYSLSYINDNYKEVFLEFILGVDFDPYGGSMPYCKLRYNGEYIVDYHSGDQEQGILYMSLTKEGNLHIDADFSILWSTISYLLPQDFYVKNLSLDFDGTYNHVTGQAKETDQNGGSGKAFHLQGRISEDAIKELRQTCRMFRMDSRKNVQLKEHFLANVGSESPATIDELFCLKAPTSIIEDGKEITGQQQVQHKSVETLYYLAVYHTAELQKDNVKYETLFGINKAFARARVEEIEPSILDLLNDDEVTNFLEKYAKVTLGNAIASSSDAELIKSLQAVSNPSGRCRYYMSDNTSEHAMGKEPGFNTAMTYITKYVYASLVPNLRKYYKNSEDWGRQLYEYSIKRLAMLKAQDLAGASRITHIAMMLGFLNDKKQEITYHDGDAEKTVQLTYGSALYLKAFNMNLAEMAGKVIFDTDDHANFINMMKQVFGVVYDELQKEESDKFSPDILKELKEEMAQFEKMTKDSFIDNCLEVAEEAMNIALVGGDILLCISAIGKKYANTPKMNFCGKIVSLSFMSFSLFQCGRMFADWKELTWQEQAESVCVFIAGIANAGAVLIRWRSLKILLNPNASVSEKINAATILKYGGEDFDVIAGTAKSGGTELVETAQNSSRYVSSIQTQEGVQAQITKFTKFFRIAEIALRIINILILAFTVVLMGFDIANDFKFDCTKAIKAMDIISITFTGAACILEGITLVLDLAGAVCNAIPVVGAICMLLGFIFSIVSMILKAKDQPDPPVIQFIKDEIVPFLKTLEEPPANKNYILGAV